MNRALLLASLLALAPRIDVVQDAPTAAPDTHLAERARCERLLARAAEDPRLDLSLVPVQRTGTPTVRGWFTVPEDRAADADPAGRRLRLRVQVLPARAADPEADAVWLLHGGPGAGATAFFQREVDGWLRERRDVVLVDQRGTGRSNPLTVPLAGGDDDVQGYFESYFDPARYRAALPELLERADPRLYTSEQAVDDFDDLRAALGYAQVDLRGGSYGTRSAQVWMRRHPGSLRCVVLMGVQSFDFLNPLPHAREAQDVLDRLFDEVEGSPAYRAAFGDLRGRFQETLARFEEGPLEVTVAHPAPDRGGEPVAVRLGRDGFAEAVRLQLYTLPGNRRLPLLLLRAWQGDYRPLAEAALGQSRGVRQAISWGTLVAVTAAEDIARIDPAAIEPACAGTFLGRTRIDEQMAIAATWPHGTVSEDFAAPLRVPVPTLLLSGDADPSTAAHWAAGVARDLPHALHVVVPGGHGVFGPELDRLDAAFLEAASVEGLDLSEVEALTWPPLELPPAVGPTEE